MNLDSRSVGNQYQTATKGELVEDLGALSLHEIKGIRGLEMQAGDNSNNFRHDVVCKSPKMSDFY